jgi:hypothetical protein
MGSAGGTSADEGGVDADVAVRATLTVRFKWRTVRQRRVLSVALTNHPRGDDVAMRLDRSDTGP